MKDSKYMINFEKVLDGLEVKTKDNGDEFIVCKYRDYPQSEEEKYISSLAVEFVEEEGGSFDLVYKMINDSFMQISEAGTIKEIRAMTDEKAEEIQDGEFASVWNATRLSYVNVWNAGDIEEHI